MSSRIDRDEDIKLLETRFRVLYVAIGCALFLFIIRLWYLQITNGQELRQFSERNRIKESKIMAPRGIIFDHQGKILAENIPGFEAVIVPQYTKDLEGTAQKVSEVLSIPAKTIVNKVQQSRRQSGSFFPCRIKDNLSRDEVFRLKILRLDHPGLDIRQVIVRNYPLREQSAHVLGYVGEVSREQLKSLNDKNPGPTPYQQGDLIGKSGIEKSFQSSIRGIDGIQFTQVDAMGREASSSSVTIFGRQIEDEKSSPGNLIYTTLDMDIQKAAFQAFVDKERTGALVAMRPTGEILAWVSYPSFDPNSFATGISSDLWKSLMNDPKKPLTNKVIQYHNSPGSTFKPFVALAGLAEKAVDPREKQYSPGTLKFGRRIYHDHQKGGHGYIDMYQALEKSSNVYFYRLGIELGIERMHEHIARLGIGQKTGIELEGEVSGLMPSPEWKKKALGEPWQPGENLSTAIGQGFVLTNLLQMASGFATIATAGKRYRPFIIERVTTPEGMTIIQKKPELVDDLTQPNSNGKSISKINFEHVQKGLWRVSNGEAGTARGHKVPGIEISGKTGTSQIMSMNSDQLFAKCDQRPREQRHHGWFISYAPSENPQIVVAVFAEHACAGSSGAAPLAKEVIKAYATKFLPALLTAKEISQ